MFKIYKKLLSAILIKIRNYSLNELLYHFSPNTPPIITSPISYISIGTYAGICQVYGSDGDSKTLSYQGDRDSFIVKYDKDGIVQWRTNIIGSTPGFFGTTDELAVSNAIDSNDNLYVSGTYTGSNIIFNNNPGDNQFSPTNFAANDGLYNTFVIKYDKDGFAQWATRIGGVIPATSSIAVDSNGSPYVFLYYTEFVGFPTIEIYHSNGNLFETVDGLGDYDTLIVKYDTNGFAQWVNRVAGTKREQSFQNTVDKTGNVCITGYYLSNPVTIYSQNGSDLSLPNNGSAYNAFVVKYDTNGDTQWATHIDSSSGGTGTDIKSAGLDSDAIGNYYTSGQYQSGPSSNSINIYNSNGDLSKTLPSNTGTVNSLYLIKYDTNGFAQWGTRINGGYYDEFYASNKVGVDSIGNSYTVGLYNSSTNPVTIYSSNGTAVPLIINSSTSNGSLGSTLGNSNNYPFVFIVKYDTNGIAQWCNTIEGPVTLGDDTNISAVTVDSDGNICVCGLYRSNITIYGSEGNATLDLDMGSSSGFIIKYDANGAIKWISKVLAETNVVTSNIATFKK